MPYELTIKSPGGTLAASFIPKLGMIGTSLRHNGEELLGQGKGLAAYVRTGAVFALPLLHPWANRLSAWEFELAGQHVTLDPDAPITHRDGATGTPIHGLLAASPHWRVTDQAPSALSAELDFGAVPEYVAAFPFPHRLRYLAHLTDTALEISLTLTATSERPVPISFGFHPYLTLPGSDRRTWRISVPAARRALTDARMLPTGEGVPLAPGALDGPLGERTFDTGFDRLRSGGGPAGPPPTPTFTLSDQHRTLALRHTDGYPVGQLYAPQRSEFVCWEPMTAPVNALISGDGLRFAAPGSPFTARFEITVS